MRRPTSFLPLLAALVAGGGFALCLPVDGAAGGIQPGFSPVADLKSAHVAAIAPPAFIACTLPDFRFLFPESLSVNRPGSRKGLSDEDDDHAGMPPVAWTPPRGDNRKNFVRGWGSLRSAGARLARRWSAEPRIAPDWLADGKGFVPPYVNPGMDRAPRDGVGRDGSDDDPFQHMFPPLAFCHPGCTPNLHPRENEIPVPVRAARPVHGPHRPAMAGFPPEEVAG